MAMKLDMSKTYNLVEWSFLQAMLSRLGFHHRWTDLIMACVTSIRYQIVHEALNLDRLCLPGDLDRETHYLLTCVIIHVEGLSALIKNFKGRGKL